MHDRYDMSDMGTRTFLECKTRTSSYIQLDQSMNRRKVLDMFSTYQATGTKIRKCSLPSDTMDFIAKEPVERY